MEKHRVIVNNKKAYHEYQILDTYSCGIVLTGAEVKSIKDQGASFNDSYVLFDRGRVVIKNLHIPLNKFDHEASKYNPTKDRFLKLRKTEIRKIQKNIEQKGLTVIPIKLVDEGGWLKVHISVAKGKKLYDKRVDDKIKTLDREMIIF